MPRDRGRRLPGLLGALLGPRRGRLENFTDLTTGETGLGYEEAKRRLEERLSTPPADEPATEVEPLEPPRALPDPSPEEPGVPAGPSPLAPWSPPLPEPRAQTRARRRAPRAPSIFQPGGALPGLSQRVPRGRSVPSGPGARSLALTFPRPLPLPQPQRTGTPGRRGGAPGRGPSGEPFIRPRRPVIIGPGPAQRAGRRLGPIPPLEGGIGAQREPNIFRPPLPSIVIEDPAPRTRPADPVRQPLPQRPPLEIPSPPLPVPLPRERPVINVPKTAPSPASIPIPRPIPRRVAAPQRRILPPFPLVNQPARAPRLQFALPTPRPAPPAAAPAPIAQPVPVPQPVPLTPDNASVLRFAQQPEARTPRERERDRCEEEREQRRRPSGVIAAVKSYRRRMSEWSLENLKRGK